MEARDRIPARLLFAIATVFGISSTVQAYWIGRLSENMHWQFADASHLLALNLTYWYVPALLAPVIMALATRFRLGRTRPGTLALVHISAALAYAAIHQTVMALTRAAIMPMSALRRGCWACVIEEGLRQLDWLLMTYLFFVGLAHALAYRRDSETQALNSSQLETRLVEAQLQSLQRQLRPHFLFNTLHTISGLMRSNPHDADRMMEQLGDLLRISLNASGAEQVPLQAELEALQKYLDIEQTRFGSRLRIEQDVEPSALNALVPYLLLQPIVENAVRYGVAPHARPGWIVIRVARAGDQLLIEVTDSGDGVPPHQIADMAHGVGLGNTRARLEHLYRDRFEFAFTNLDNGFRVTIRVPFRSGLAAQPVRTGAA